MIWLPTFPWEYIHMIDCTQWNDSNETVEQNLCHMFTQVLGISLGGSDVNYDLLPLISSDSVLPRSS